MDTESVLLLAISGFLAMILGDYLFFKSVPRIGPRLVMVIFAATPIVTGVIAWIVMRESISPRGLVGIVVIVGGITWVVSEPRGADGWTRDPREFRLGVLLSVGSLLTTAAAYAFTRAAVYGGPRLLGDGPALEPVASADAALVRLALAGGLAWIALPFSPALKPTIETVTSARMMLLVVPGTIAGLFLGSWFSMMALARMPGGIASALLSCSPIFMIPLTRIFFGERHSARALVGTVVTIAGVFVLLV
jgi:drug/metabolite transporter (DMT)-like permease